MNRLCLLIFLPIIALGGCAWHHITAKGTNSVDLYLVSPFAEEVLFFSSQDCFLPQPAHKILPAYWKVTVEYTEQFAYFFTVDNKVIVPDCDYRELDDFGHYNCIYPSNL